MLTYILIAVLFECLGAVLRSFFGPLILVRPYHTAPVTAFTEHYRLIVYSVTDFLVGMALLYLIYCQGQVALRLQKGPRRPGEEEEFNMDSLTKFKDLSGGDGDEKPKAAEVSKQIVAEGERDRRETWEEKLLEKHSQKTYSQTKDAVIGGSDRSRASHYQVQKMVSSAGGSLISTGMEFQVLQL